MIDVHPQPLTPAFARILSFLAVALCIVLSGCASMATSFHSEDEIAYMRSETIHALVIKDGSKIVFNEEGGIYTNTAARKEDRAITGTTVDGRTVAVAARDIVEVEIRKPVLNGSRTIAGVSLAVLSVAFFVLLRGLAAM